MDPNGSPAARQAVVSVNDAPVTIAQVAAPCAFSISPRSATLGVAGGAAAVQVAAMNGCLWTSASNSPWIAITGGSSGNGNGAVALSVAANADAARSGTVTVAGQAFTVSQPAALSTSPAPAPPSPPPTQPPPPPPPPPPPACGYVLAPTSATFSAGAGNGIVAVTTTASCAWTAASNNPDWISLTSGASGTGLGLVKYTVKANPDKKSRTGHLTIAGITVTVVQDASSKGH